MGSRLIRRRLAILRRLPPGAIARRALGMIGRRAGAIQRRHADAREPTYSADPPAAGLTPLLATPPIEAIRAQSHWIVPAAELYRHHYFDLLGSGWRRIEHGMSCSGLEGILFPSGSAVAADPEGNWLAGRINPANLARSQHYWRLVEPGYLPIDWQLDFKSGYRWDEGRWSEDLPFGHRPGIDVKLPWELARMQHATILAFAYALAQDGVPGLQPARWYLAAFRDQLLDFIACNPPRFGINWRCGMDVAIRAANWVLAYDLFRAFGARFDEPFAQALGASLLDHGRHIARHLEFYPEGRGNHYLADIAGLIFIAAALPRTGETDAWLAFGVQELLAETEYQFGKDGANFEASTSYHRLSAEMVVFTTALILGLSPEKRAAIAEADPAMLATRPSRVLAAARRMPDARHLTRIAQMAEFTRCVTKPNGLVAQIGDNDSGRFFKLHPIFIARSPAESRAIYADFALPAALSASDAILDEEILDHRPLVGAVGTLLGRRDLRHFADTDWLDGRIVAALAPEAALSAASVLAPRPLANLRIAEGESAAKFEVETLVNRRSVEIVAPGGDLREGLSRAGFPDFGVWIFRSTRLFLAVRCGSIGYDGRGAHAHNDQLAIELAIDGEDWIVDPGSYLYTPRQDLRNAYRSVQAHCAPRCGDIEPGNLALGDFWLGDEAKANCLLFEDCDFLGEHHGFGKPVRRRIHIGETSITITDTGLPVPPVEARLRCVGRGDCLAAMSPPVPFSPGYGKRYRQTMSPLS